ncbi:hypothetical protein BDK51DRAFT_41038 [Blyttiomyces helicus]|uniref:Uncharacterized protein n=1 Tax=Blyttiomyces helicus TaxID=388810 RepID=A0A4P9W252_9FUNG|nr:hypothetical protein BDK51DRAFT_41038 [Blyttiomyces helicus]|eukprot:RKO85455.1 hypothetical protein BDK51DRAFT_41038 [Blyttiomyces helicus]
MKCFTAVLFLLALAAPAVLAAPMPTTLRQIAGAPIKPVTSQSTGGDDSLPSFSTKRGKTLRPAAPIEPPAPEPEVVPSGETGGDDSIASRVPITDPSIDVLELENYRSSTNGALDQLIPRPTA